MLSFLRVHGCLLCFSKLCYQFLRSSRSKLIHWSYGLDGSKYGWTFNRTLSFIPQNAHVVYYSLYNGLFSIFFVSATFNNSITLSLHHQGLLNMVYNSLVAPLDVVSIDLSPMKTLCLQYLHFNLCVMSPILSACSRQRFFNLPLLTLNTWLNSPEEDFLICTS